MELHFPSDQSNGPPIPPPLPISSEGRAHRPQFQYKVAETESGFWKKFQSAQGAFYKASDPGPLIDPLAPRTGPYFFYGSLMDPNILKDILTLNKKPELRSAKIIGYSCKMWGQYPALVIGPQDGVVLGVMFEVQSEGHAARLAEYETKAYSAAPCEIRLTDAGEPSRVSGMTFRYTGPKLDLENGEFDLKIWLQRIGRGNPHHLNA